MLTVCGCQIPDDDVRVLIGRLEDDITLDSDEAAGALKFALDTKADAISLDPGIREAIKAALYEDPLPLSLDFLRQALNDANG
jgi:hypothetical protein